MSFFVDILFDKKIQSKIFLIPPNILAQLNPDSSPIFDSFTNNTLSLNHGSIILKNPETKVYLGETVGILIWFTRSLIPLKNFELQISPEPNFQVTLSTPKTKPVQSLSISISEIDLYQAVNNSAFFKVLPRMDGLLKLKADISFYIEQKKLSFSKRFAFQVCLPFYASIRVRSLFQVSNDNYFNNSKANDNSSGSGRRRKSSFAEATTPSDVLNNYYISSNCQDFIIEFSLANIRRSLYDISAKLILNPAYKCNDPNKQICPILNSKSVIRSLFTFSRVDPKNLPKNVGYFVITWTTENKETFSTKIAEPSVQFKNILPSPLNYISLIISKSPSSGLIMQPFSIELSFQNLLNKPISFNIGFHNSDQNAFLCNEEKSVDDFQPNAIEKLMFSFLPIREGILTFPNALITLPDSTQFLIPLNGGILITQ